MFGQYITSDPLELWPEGDEAYQALCHAAHCVAACNGALILKAGSEHFLGKITGPFICLNVPYTLCCRCAYYHLAPPQLL